MHTGHKLLILIDISDPFKNGKAVSVGVLIDQEATVQKRLVQADQRTTKTSTRTRRVAAKTQKSASNVSADNSRNEDSSDGEGYVPAAGRKGVYVSPVLSTVKCT